MRPMFLPLTQQPLEFSNVSFRTSIFFSNLKWVFLWCEYSFANYICPRWYFCRTFQYFSCSRRFYFLLFVCQTWPSHKLLNDSPSAHISLVVWSFSSSAIVNWLFICLAVLISLLKKKLNIAKQQYVRTECHASRFIPYALLLSTWAHEFNNHTHECIEWDGEIVPQAYENTLCVFRLWFWTGKFIHQTVCSSTLSASRTHLFLHQPNFDKKCRLYRIVSEIVYSWIYAYRLIFSAHSCFIHNFFFRLNEKIILSITFRMQRKSRFYNTSTNQWRKKKWKKYVCAKLT